ncbi:MAG: PQQ-binding-like beta-propeller repeat protein, partial [Rhodopirellula sp. JB044]|uniref:outer membrane protein assembly factor BamB family protein n=1 Tax=Rhodopirellula sp. JB044 TaxID=3342844 RepID=UPI00370BFBF7
MSRPLQPMWESLMRDERAWRRIAIIAGVLSVLIVTVMLVSFFARETDPSLDGTYVELKQSLQDARGDLERHGTIANQIRVLDVELRKEYFDRRAFMTVASWLLLASVFVTIASAKMVATIGRRAPILGEMMSDGGDPDAMISVQSISAVGGFALGVLLFSGWLIVSARNVLPSSANQIAALFPEPESIVSVSTGSNNEATLAETTSKVERADDGAIEKDLLPTAQATPLPTLDERLKNWTRFRGTDGSGVGLNASIPEAWDVESGEGVLWKSPIELPGSNSPIVWEDRVFLSGATAEERAVYCFDTRTGDLVWQTEVPLPAPELDDGEPVEMEVNDDTGFAAPTMTTDGVRVYAMFAHGDVVAMSFDGEIAWRREFGFPNNPYGHASSLVAEGDV